MVICKILRIHISNQIQTNPVIVRVNPTDDLNLANTCVCSGWLASQQQLLIILMIFKEAKDKGNVISTTASLSFVASGRLFWVKNAR